MSNDDILSTLNDLETAFYQKYAGYEPSKGISHEDLEKMYALIGECLNLWNSIMDKTGGCK